jgi:hypothetical protein
MDSVVFARASATFIGEGITFPTKRFISGRTKRPRVTRVIVPALTCRDKDWSTDARVPQSKNAVGLKGSPTGISNMRWRICLAVEMAEFMMENIADFLTLCNQKSCDSQRGICRALERSWP